MCSDPLAFQWLSKRASSLARTKFIDVDFPDLIKRKSDVIANAPQLRGLLGSFQVLNESSGVSLRSEHYTSIGCDLSDLVSLETLLQEELDASTSLILCVAEVSVTYMNVDSADALIKWAADYDDGISSIKRLAVPVSR